MRRPAPERLSDIQHPGPRSDERLPHRLCKAEKVSFDLPPGTSLLKALADWTEAAGYDSAVLDLTGLVLSPFDYVMPDRAIDDRHAAWYSDTRHSDTATLTEAVAIVGRRDGRCFAHIHACWTERGETHLGHLLPETLQIGAASQVGGFGIKGAQFVSQPDPETEFTLFRVTATPERGPGKSSNALIATLAPFEDLPASVQSLREELGASAVKVVGLGSLAGASFTDADPMRGLISEILLQPECGAQDDGTINLPVRCIDFQGGLYTGHLQTGMAPTLITCELLVIADD
ncbi:MAG: hypothetical protein AAFN16_25255 [Pseudomonadota bacterium]